MPADHVGGSHQQVFLDVRPACGGQGVAHQGVAEGHGDEPHAFVERLRHDMPAAHLFLAVDVVQRIGRVAIGIRQQDLARAWRVFLAPGEAVGEAQVADRSAQAGVHVAEGHRVVRIAVVDRAAERAAVRGWRIGHQRRAVLLAAIPVRPLPAAGRQFNLPLQVACGLREHGLERCLGPRLGLGLAFCRLDAGLIDEQVIVLGQRRAIRGRLRGEGTGGEARQDSEQQQAFCHGFRPGLP